MIGIYKITNLRNGKSYIGQSVNIEKRFKDHLSDKAAGHGKSFAEDLAQYGKTAFELTVLEECDRDELIDRERAYIKELRPEYNEVVYGEGRGIEFRSKVSDGVKRWWKQLDEATKERLKLNLMGPGVGHEVSKETREKLRQANLGKKQSNETIEKRRVSLSVRYEKKPKDGRGHFKPVGCENGTTFESVKACAEYFDVHPSTVTAALKKKHRVKGFKVWYVV